MCNPVTASAPFSEDGCLPCHSETAAPGALQNAILKQNALLCRISSVAVGDKGYMLFVTGQQVKNAGQHVKLNIAGAILTKIQRMQALPLTAIDRLFGKAVL